MKKARMNISHSRFILSKLKIFGELVTTFLISVDTSEANILTEFGVTTHPQTDPLNINFFNSFC